MRVTWERAWPRWVGVVCAVFGFANIAGSLMAPRALILPGLVIGSVWAVVGLNRGLPLFASTSQAGTSQWGQADASLPGQEDGSSRAIAEGLRTIRRRRLRLYLSIVASFPLLYVNTRFPGNATVFVLAALPMFACFAIWRFSACPRCNRHFYPPFRLVAPWNRCGNCGLGLRDATT